MKIVNGTIINPEKNEMYKADLEVVSPADYEDRDLIIDATGLYIAPGMADTHVHFRDPGFTYKEDIISGAEAAKKGGYTQIVLMANTNPKVDNTETLKYVLNKGKDTGIHINTCANVTMGMKGEILTPMEELKAAGAVGFTDDGVPVMNADVCLEAMKQCAKLGVPISFHEENTAFIDNNGVNRGAASEHYGIGGSPREAEIDLISRDIDLARRAFDELKAEDQNIRCPKIVIQHISTKEGVELVRAAKTEGLDIHAEATPHHFSLNQEAVIKFGTNAKMNPPLRTEEDRLAILEGLKDGTIDLIATDHAPHSAEEKAKTITEAPSGIIGLETSLSLSIKHLINAEILTYPQLFNRISLAPCRLYGIEGGTVDNSLNQDLIIFDPDEKWVVSSFKSKSSNSPFIGEELPGVIKYTICGGQIVYKSTCR